MGGFFASIERWDLPGFGIWCLLPALVIVATVLPALFLPLILAFTPIISLTVVCEVSIAALQPGCAGYDLGIRARSPPIL